MDREIGKLQIRYNVRGLDVVQAVYAFIIALGLQEIFVGSHDFFTNVLFEETNTTLEQKIIIIVIFFNIVLLGMRFFWVPRNLRRAVYFSALYGAQQDAEKKERLSRTSNSFLALNWFIIVIHGLLFFMLCSEFEFIVFSSTASGALQPAILNNYFALHIILLIVNALWIGLLARREYLLRGRNGQETLAEDMSGGVTWFRNNIFCALLALGPLAAFGDCLVGIDGAAAPCLETLGAFGPAGAPVTPADPATLGYAFLSTTQTVSAFLAQHLSLEMSPQYFITY